MILNYLLGILLLAQTAILPALAQAADPVAVDHRVEVIVSEVTVAPAAGANSLTVRIKNKSSAPILAPLRLHVGEIEGQPIQPLNATGQGADSQPYIEFPLPHGQLNAGATTAAVTLNYRPAVQPIRTQRSQGRRARHGDEGGRVVAGVIQAPLALRTDPYALTAGGSPQTVRFSVMLANRDAKKNAAVTPVFLRNKDSRAIYPMHDHGRRANVVSIEIDPSALMPETCLNFEAYLLSGGVEVVSPPYKLCASGLPVRVAKSDKTNLVTLPDGSKAIADEILLHVATGTSEAQIRALADSINAGVAGGLMQLGLYQLKLHAPLSAADIQSLIEQLQTRPNVVSASFNVLGEASFTPSDPEYSSQHGLTLVRAQDVWDAGANGTGITVVTLDTGIDRNHADFGTSPGNCQLAEDDCGAGNTDVTTGPTAAGHGTQVAGVVAAKTDNALGVAGVAYGSKIHAINIADFTLLSMVNVFTAAAAYVNVNGNAQVVNASFNILDAFSDMTPLCTAINSVVLNGVTPRAIVVNAAGNQNINGASYPARCNDLNAGLTNKSLFITVSNSISVVTPDCGSLAVDQRCSTSNYGAWVDIAAPGSAIRTTTIGGGYASPTGTSFSAPMVSGAVAILRSCGVPLVDIESTLETSANVNVAVPYPLSGANPAGTTPRLDIHRALIARNRAPTAVTLSNNTLNNGTDTSSGVEVGTLLATDLDTCDKFTYSITGGADAAAFSIGGAGLDRLRITAGVLNSAVKPSYTVTVAVTDFAGQAASTTHVITVTAPATAQCADGLDNDGDGKIDFPADPGCSAANDNSENTNVNPAAPVLVSPANASSNVNGASVTFTWQRATDPDGDTVSYEFYLCTNAAFTNCGPVVVARNDHPAATLGAWLGGGLGGGILLMGLLGTNRSRNRKLKHDLAGMLFLLTLISCGGGGGGVGSGGSNNNVTHTVTMLSGATTYYWKAVAVDDHGGSASSAVYSFTTQ